MSVRKKANGKWFYRKWVKAPTWVKPVRVFGMPDEYGLPNTKTGAQEAERRKLREILDGDRRQPTAAAQSIGSTTPLLREYAPTYLERCALNNKLSTHETKETLLERHIVAELGDRHLDEIDYDAIEDFKAALLKRRMVIIDGKSTKIEKLGAKSINNCLSVLRNLLTLARKRHRTINVPDIEWLEIEDVDFDFLTFDEASALLRSADQDGEWGVMVLVAQRTGLRQGELIGLQWSDVDFKKGVLRVKRTVYRGRIGSPKGGRWRDVDLGDDVLRVLKAHRHLRGEWVFCDMDGKRFTDGKCKHPLWRACARAGIRRIGWHVLRHTFASHLAMKGVPLRRIQDLLGHSTIRMTERYAHLMPDADRDAVRLLDTGA